MNKVSLYLYKYPKKMDDKLISNIYENIIPTEESFEKMSKQRKREFVVGRFLLKVIIEKHLNNSFNLAEIIKDKNGKLFIPNDPIHFNISHTKNFCVIAISDELKVGIDIEEVNLNRKRIPFMIFNQDFINNSTCDSDELTFMAFLIWTLKECYLKMIGIGIQEDIKNIKLLNVSASFYTILIQNIIISVAVEAKNENKISVSTIDFQI